MRGWVRSAAVIVTAAVVLCTGAAPAADAPQAKATRPALASLHSVDDLRTEFNKDRGQVRIVCCCHQRDQRA